MRILGTIASASREVPGAPTIGTATNVGTGRAYNNGRADVTFTAPAFDGGFPILDYTVTSSPGGYTTTGAASPLTVTGLQSGVAYTFTVTARTAIGTGPASAASNSITATTVPQTPTITSATRTGNTTVSIAFTGATGGAALSAVTATSSPSVSITSSGTSSPMTATATYSQGQAYTFTITASNANGTSGSSNTSSSVTPYPAPVLSAWSASTDYPLTNNSAGTGSTTGVNQVWIGGYFNGAAGFYSGDAYYWNGSSWSARPGLSVGLQGACRINTTQVSIFGGIATYGYYSEDRVDIMSGSGLSNDTNMPYAAYRVGVASVSGGLVLVGGQGGQPAYKRYYKNTPVGGTWTLGTDSPFQVGSVSGSDLKDFTNGVFYSGYNSESYTVTSNTSAFTAATARPTGAPAQSYTSISVINNQTLLYKGNDDNGNTYLFDGTTYTLQTSLPTPNYTWYTGAVGTTASAVRSQLHYRSTLS